jgi:hypothetical protein
MDANGLQLFDAARYKTSKEFCRPLFNKHISLLSLQNRIFDIGIGISIAAI